MRFLFQAVAPGQQLFTRATSQSLCLHKTLAVLSASGACSAPTEVERRCRDNEENSQGVFSEVVAQPRS